MKLTVESREPLFTASSELTCATIDWWPSSKCDYGTCMWGSTSIKNLDLSNQFLRNAVAAFGGKLRLRLGGSLGDFVVYNVPGSDSAQGYCTYADFSPPTLATKIGYEFFSGCLEMSRWDEVNEFAMDVGAEIAFGLNGLYGRKPPKPCPAGTICHIPGPPSCCTSWSGSWDLANSRALVEYTKEKGYPVTAWELGNELVGPRGIQSHLSVKQYVKDWRNFVSMIDDVYGSGSGSSSGSSSSGNSSVKRPLLVATDTTWDKDWYESFLRKCEDADDDGGSRRGPDVVTHHLYSMGKGLNPDAWEAALDNEYMDKVAALGDEVQETVEKAAPGASVWLGEGGGFYNSGADNATNAFNSGFWFMDQLGVLASRGHSAFCRQTLVGGYYGLLDTTTMKPRPDYYLYLLWSKIMGRRALEVSRKHSISNVVRVYAHCSAATAPFYSPGAITLVVINLSDTVTVQLRLSTVTTSTEEEEESEESEDKDLLARSRYEYIFSSACGSIAAGADKRTLLACRETLLNGQLLSPNADGTIPDFVPKKVKPSPLVLSPLTLGFVILPRARAAACM